MCACMWMSVGVRVGGSNLAFKYVTYISGWLLCDSFMCVAASNMQAPIVWLLYMCQTTLSHHLPELSGRLKKENLEIFLFYWYLWIDNFVVQIISLRYYKLVFFNRVHERLKILVDRCLRVGSSDLAFRCVNMDESWSIFKRLGIHDSQALCMYTCDMTHPYHTCDVTLIYVWHDSQGYSYLTHSYV